MSTEAGTFPCRSESCFVIDILTSFFDEYVVGLTSRRWNRACSGCCHVFSGSVGCFVKASGPNLGIAAKDSYAHTGWNAEWYILRSWRLMFFQVKIQLFSVRLPLLPLPNILKLICQGVSRWQMMTKQVSSSVWRRMISQTKIETRQMLQERSGDPCCWICMDRVFLMARGELVFLVLAA